MCLCFAVQCVSQQLLSLCVFSQNFRCSLRDCGGNEICEGAARQPVFTCSWKPLCKFYHRERAPCVKLFQTLQDIRNEKMLRGFQQRGDMLRHVLAGPARTFCHLQGVVVVLARNFIIILILSKIGPPPFTNRCEATQAMWTRQYCCVLFSLALVAAFKVAKQNKNQFWVTHHERVKMSCGMTVCSAPASESYLRL